MDCTECRTLIDAYLDDELTHDVKERFVAHISSCEECKRELSFAQGVKSTLTSLPKIEVPSDFNERLSKKLAEQKKHSSFVKLTAKYGTLAACIILAVVLHDSFKETDFSNTPDYSEMNTYTAPVAPTVEEDISVSSATEDVLATSPTPSARSVSRASRKATAQENVTSAEPAEIAPSNDANNSVEENNMSGAPVAKAYTLDSGDAVTQNSSDNSHIEIFISNENSAKVKELALSFATLDGNIYTADKNSFTSFIDKLSAEGIIFSQSSEPDTDTVIFEITAS